MCPIQWATPPVTALAIGTFKSNIQIYWADEKQIFLQELNISQRCKHPRNNDIRSFYNPQNSDYKIRGIAVTPEDIFWIDDSDTLTPFF